MAEEDVLPHRLRSNDVVTGVRSQVRSSADPQVPARLARLLGFVLRFAFARKMLDLSFRLGSATLMRSAIG
jgi:hypothetical protein